MDPWQSSIPDTLTFDNNGTQTPLREHPFVKETPDLPTFVKRAFDAHREIGSRIPVKVDKPEDVAKWRETHLPTLYKAGLLDAPPATPDEYGIAKPANLPEGFTWNEDAGKELAGVLHKYGIPKAAAPELLALHTKILAGMQAQNGVDRDAAMTQLKTEHGAAFEEREEMAKRLVSSVIKDPAELQRIEREGFGNNVGLLTILMRLAPLAMQDSSFLKEAHRPDGTMSGEEARAENARIMSDKTHPMHEGYLRRDKKVLDHIDAMYKKAYGDGTVELGGGITVGPRPQ